MTVVDLLTLVEVLGMSGNESWKTFYDLGEAVSSASLS